jgi:hypothetical protein
VSPAAALRRIRAYGGQFTLLAVLALVAALLTSGVPRVANRLAEEGLREYVAARPASQRDVTYDGSGGSFDPWLSTPRSRLDRLDQLRSEMPAVLARSVRESWYAAQTTPARTRGPDLGRAKLNGLLLFAFVVGATGGAVLGLLAIALAVLAGAPKRRQLLARLHPLGLSRRQGRALLAVELVPLVGGADADRGGRRRTARVAAEPGAGPGRVRRWGTGPGALDAAAVSRRSRRPVRPESRSTCPDRARRPRCSATTPWRNW